MTKYVHLRAAAELLGIPTSRLYGMDKLLRPQVRVRGTKQKTRWYSTDVLERVRQQLTTPPVAPHRAGEREVECACGCGELLWSRATKSRKWVRGHRGTCNHVLKAFCDCVRPARSATPKSSRGLGGHTTYESRYGLSFDRLVEIFASQDSRCACCGSDDPGSGSYWNVDHDHTTNQIRGVVCTYCNQFIARARDPVTGERDNLRCLEIAYENTRRYLLSVESRLKFSLVSVLKKQLARDKLSKKIK